MRRTSCRFAAIALLTSCLLYPSPASADGWWPSWPSDWLPDWSGFTDSVAHALHKIANAIVSDGDQLVAQGQQVVDTVSTIAPEAEMVLQEALKDEEQVNLLIQLADGTFEYLNSTALRSLVDVLNLIQSKGGNAITRVVHLVDDIDGITGPVKKVADEIAEHIIGDVQVVTHQVRGSIGPNIEAVTQTFRDQVAPNTALITDQLKEILPVVKEILGDIHSKTVHHVSDMAQTTTTVLQDLSPYAKAMMTCVAAASIVVGACATAAVVIYWRSQNGKLVRSEQQIEEGDLPSSCSTDSKRNRENLLQRLLRRRSHSESHGQRQELQPLLGSH